KDAAHAVPEARRIVPDLILQQVRVERPAVHEPKGDLLDRGLIVHGRKRRLRTCRTRQKRRQHEEYGHPHHRPAAASSSGMGAIWLESLGWPLLSLSSAACIRSRSRWSRFIRTRFSLSTAISAPMMRTTPE